MSRRIKVAGIGEIAPGRGALAQVEGREIALFNLDGVFYATEAICPHRGGPLQDGDLEGEAVICPLHNYDFNLKTGESSAAPDLRVATFPVVVEGQDIYLDLP
jgi:nitrite reductase (NADH) small subunit